MHGRKEMVALMGLAKAPPPLSKPKVDRAAWRAFKDKHNQRYLIAEDKARRAKRRTDGGDKDG